jgi:large subunit ribosomal protein L9
MGNIKVILKKDVPNLGEEGDIKTVKSGYARNFLFAQKLAVDCSIQNKNIYEKQKASIEQRKLEKKEHAKELKAKLDAAKVDVTIIAGDKGRLYGTVTTSLIADELVKLGFDIDKKKLELKDHIKFAGLYKVYIHLYEDIIAAAELNVIAKQEEKKEDTRPRRKKRYNKYSEYEEQQDVETEVALKEETEVEAKEDKE